MPHSFQFKQSEPWRGRNGILLEGQEQSCCVPSGTTFPVIHVGLHPCMSGSNIYQKGSAAQHPSDHGMNCCWSLWASRGHQRVMEEQLWGTLHQPGASAEGRDRFLLSAPHLSQQEIQVGVSSREQVQEKETYPWPPLSRAEPGTLHQSQLWGSPGDTSGRRGG